MSPLSTSLIVPSPPHAKTTLAPADAASRASIVPCPLCDVASTATSQPSDANAAAALCKRSGRGALRALGLYTTVAIFTASVSHLASHSYRDGRRCLCRTHQPGETSVDGARGLPPPIRQ